MKKKFLLQNIFLKYSIDDAIALEIKNEATKESKKVVVVQRELRILYIGLFFNNKTIPASGNNKTINFLVN